MSDFELWHPTFTEHPDGFQCITDVTAADFAQLNTGTDESMSAFTDALGTTAGALQWNVTPYLSPYFAYTPWPAQDTDGGIDLDPDWRNHFGLAWRVRIVVDQRPPFRYGGLGPYYADTYDTTWDDRSAYTGRPGEQHDIIVLADGGPTGNLSFLDELAPPEAVEHTAAPGAVLPLYRVRIPIGRAYPPDTIPGLAPVMHALGVHLYSTHHTTTASYHVPWPDLTPW